jgi:hypothetical protein
MTSRVCRPAVAVLTLSLGACSGQSGNSTSAPPPASTAAAAPAATPAAPAPQSAAPTTTNPASAEAAPGPTDAVPSTASPAASPTAAPAAAPIADTAAAAPAATTPPPPPEPVYREVTIPAGTNLAVELRTTLASDANHVEDPVRGTLRHSVMTSGVQALAAGAAVSGHVTEAERSGRVKGKAVIGFRFTAIDPPGDGTHATIHTATIRHEASATKKKDAAKIGGGAAGGALLGALIGGGDGAAKGAAIGGAAGTGVVLGTRGEEISVPAGTQLTVRLTAPLTVRVLVK